LGFPRKPLKYIAAIPSTGIGPHTGGILFICPWGMHLNASYCRETLLPRLADRHDCVVAAPEYFGITIKSDPNTVLHPPAGLTEGIRKMFGDAIANQPLVEQLRTMAAAGLTEIPTQLAFAINHYPEYQSFGLMPALDMVAVLAELLRRYPLRRDRLHCFGSSYGGYVASILLKLMPNTFHVIVENSGFVEAQPAEMANLEFNGYNWLDIQGVRVPVFHASPWTFKDPTSPRFADAGVMAIRSCLQTEHYAPSKTLMRSYHSAHDRLIPIEQKRQFWTGLTDKLALRAVTVTPNDIDGRLFKTVEHGMDASLLDMMADAMTDTPVESHDARTDFDRRTERVLPAAGRSYVFKFSEDLSCHAEVLRA
jgi:pimeloyl-ACP methyl ester carboxylesterase